MAYLPTIYHQHQPNVVKHTIDGSYGYESMNIFRFVQPFTRSCCLKKVTSCTIDQSISTASDIGRSSKEDNFSHCINSSPQIHMGVSKNKGTPKWMVYSGKPY